MSLLTNYTNNISQYTERCMQLDIIEQLKTREYIHHVSSNGAQHFQQVKPLLITDEVRIPQIGRISDIVIAFTPRKIINIECKLADVGGVIKQAEDHLQWCDYSYIAMPQNCYIAPKYFKTCIDKNIGVILFTQGQNFTEVIKAQHNRKKDNKLRKEVNKILRL